MDPEVLSPSMTMQTLVPLVLLWLAPTALATGILSWPVAVGVATPGSYDAHEQGGVCLAVLTPMTLEVALLAGAEADALLVTADAVGADDPQAYATIGAPAILRYVSPDSCSRFTVEGAFVENVAVYEGAALVDGTS